jgi:formate C-acetyltransferase
MEHCRDLHTHGEYVPGGDHSCLDPVGKGTAIDSLAAVKHLIFFATKKLTWELVVKTTLDIVTNEEHYP